MVKENRILPSTLSTYCAQLRRTIKRSPTIFIIGFLCAWILFTAFSKKATCQGMLPPSISFSGESNAIYFLDRDNARLYRYNTQGRLTRLYIIKELGKDLQLK